MHPDPDGTSPRASQNPAQIEVSKDVLRAQVRSARTHHTDTARLDALRFPHLLGLTADHTAIACYISTPTEPGTWPLLEALWRRGLAILVPVVRDRSQPSWAWCSGPDELRTGFRGIPQPTGPALGNEALGICSMIIVPALMATPRGDRLGTGGGWYDRALLHRAPAAPIAVVLDSRNVVDTLPVEPWDVRADLLVTEDGVSATVTE